MSLDAAKQIVPPIVVTTSYFKGDEMGLADGPREHFVGKVVVHRDTVKIYEAERPKPIFL